MGYTCIAGWYRALKSALLGAAPTVVVSGAEGEVRTVKAGCREVCLCDSIEDVLLSPVGKNLRDVDLIEWSTGGHCHLEDSSVIDSR